MCVLLCLASSSSRISLVALFHSSIVIMIKLFKKKKKSIFCKSSTFYMFPCHVFIDKGKN